MTHANSQPPHRAGRALFALCLLLPLLAVAGEPTQEDERRRVHAYSFELDLIEGELSATPGGAQDIAFFRDRVLGGEIPHPSTITPEGLFSEHDLPVVSASPCEHLLCATGVAAPTSLIAQPEVRAIAQLGFSTNLDGDAFRRAPLNLIAVVDKSGSMSGAPLELVKASLARVVTHLGPADQLSIVLYGDRSHLFLPPTRLTAAGLPAVERAIAAIESAGSTAMEEGLRVAFDLAAASALEFAGTTRVMLFTDERPNVGATDAQSFMAMAETASSQGIGMTTVGVGVQFGAELAARISSVRGGNLFFFPDIERMAKVFTEDFELMVTELAYDLELTITPAPGHAIAGVYGVPGERLQWTDEGSIRLEVATLFASRRRGAIFVAFSPVTGLGMPAELPHAGETMGHIALSYERRDGERRDGERRDGERRDGERRDGERRDGTRERATVGLELLARAPGGSGLARGIMLVDQVTVLRAATELHHTHNDQEGSYQLVHALAARYRQATDEQLDDEREMVFALEDTLALLAGRRGEGTQVTRRDGVSGLPTR